MLERRFMVASFNSLFKYVADFRTEFSRIEDRTHLRYIWEKGESLANPKNKFGVDALRILQEKDILGEIRASEVEPFPPSLLISYHIEDIGGSLRYLEVCPLEAGVEVGFRSSQRSDKERPIGVFSTTNCFELMYPNLYFKLHYGRVVLPGFED